MSSFLSLLTCMCTVWVCGESLVDGPRMSFAAGIICLQDSQTCCDTSRDGMLTVEDLMEDVERIVLRKLNLSVVINQKNFRFVKLRLSRIWRKVQDPWFFYWTVLVKQKTIGWWNFRASSFRELRVWSLRYLNNGFLKISFCQNADEKKKRNDGFFWSPVPVKNFAWGVCRRNEAGSVEGDELKMLICQFD